MKLLSAKSVLMWLLSLVMLAALASCGGSDDGDAVLAFGATLTGAQEAPSNASTATGTGTANFDPATRILTASVTTAGVAGTVAHIHSGAVGISGPIVFPLTQSAAGSGIWSTTTAALTDAQVALLQSGGYYFNVHSAALPNGEIRGQITAAASGSGFQAAAPAAAPAPAAPAPAAPAPVAPAPVAPAPVAPAPVAPAPVAPAPVAPAPVALDGAALYASNCAGCHGALASSGKLGASASSTQAAINANVGGMGSASLRALTPAQVSAIATALGGAP